MFEHSETLAWVILFLPLMAAVGIALFTRRSASTSAWLSIGAVVLSFLLSCALFASVPKEKGLLEVSFTWLSVGSLHVDMGARLDALSLVMLLIVTGVGSAIHIYSFGYMREDPAIARFFASMSLFMFSMIGIVLSNNFLQLFVFWELVGVSSYLLIGFWYER